MLDKKALQVINAILSRGNTAEVRRRKDSIVVIEVKGKTQYKVTADE